MQAELRAGLIFELRDRRGGDFGNRDGIANVGAKTCLLQRSVQTQLAVEHCILVAARSRSDLLAFILRVAAIAQHVSLRRDARPLARAVLVVDCPIHGARQLDQTSAGSVRQFACYTRRVEASFVHRIADLDRTAGPAGMRTHDIRQHGVSLHIHTARARTNQLDALDAFGRNPTQHVLERFVFAGRATAIDQHVAGSARQAAYIRVAVLEFVARQQVQHVECGVRLGTGEETSGIDGDGGGTRPWCRLILRVREACDDGQ